MVLRSAQARLSQTVRVPINWFRLPSPRDETKRPQDEVGTACTILGTQTQNFPLFRKTGTKSLNSDANPSFHEVGVSPSFGFRRRIQQKADSGIKRRHAERCRLTDSPQCLAHLDRVRLFLLLRACVQLLLPARKALVTRDQARSTREREIGPHPGRKH